MIRIIPDIHRDSIFPSHEQAKQEVEVQRIIPKPKDGDDIPEGYLTDEEFWKLSRERLDNLCRKYGLLE